MVEKFELHTDVLVIGSGPSGFAAEIFRAPIWHIPISEQCPYVWELEKRQALLQLFLYQRAVI